MAGLTAGFWRTMSFGTPVVLRPGADPHFGLDSPTRGRFLAGRDAEPVAVSLIPTRRHLELRDGMGLLVAAWAWGDVVRRSGPVASLGRSAPLSGLEAEAAARGGGSLWLSCRVAPFQRLEVLDRDTPVGQDLALGRVPSVVAPSRVSRDPFRPSARARLWSGLRGRLEDLTWDLGGAATVRRLLRVLGLGLSMLLLGMALGFAALVLPGVANRMSDLVSPAREAEWGAHLARAAITDIGRPVCARSRGGAALEHLAVRLARTLPAPWPVQIHVVADLRPQALVLPGGHLVLFEGMIRDSRSPDALAGLLAHQLAHAALGHGTDAVVRRHGFGALWALMTGAWEDPRLDLESYLAVQTARRAREQDADALALRLLNDSGLRRRSLALFRDQADRLGAVTPVAAATGPGHRGLVLAPFADRHPVSAGQMRDLRQVPRGGAEALDPADWEALSMICATREAAGPASSGGVRPVAAWGGDPARSLSGAVR